ncbi:hypothetical protein PUMCH_004876 [Australozyma saopauloensis]|uniref:Uncharacterized protein n=1 Tax=Australozyma saopauloensis TaxID=291208 RepID=A0AAX4HGU0_9ASCO|nr:hypothetical protein PUMCH_004876 [[Candida] saopauloensis]
MIGTIPIFLYLLNFLLLSFALPFGQKPILRLTANSHDKSIVSSILFEAYSEAYLLNAHAKANYITNFHSLALQYTADDYCVDKTSIRYYVKSFAVDTKSYPASQCALNLNSRFSSILLPEEDFHENVHGTTDLLTYELEMRAELYILELPSFSFEFNDFDDLNYDLECFSEYYELMQVMYQEKVLTVNLQLQVTVPDQCTFKKLNPEFDTNFDQLFQTVQLPMSGEFFCKSGTSVSCKMSMANTRNVRYKLFE